MSTTTAQVYRWREANPEKAKRLDERNAEKLQENKAFVDALKSEQGCLDCGYKDHACALQFHHRDPTTKLASISNMYKRSLDLILEEIAKCDLLCANCHSVRTWT